ncbi:hypothetical protein SAMN04488137_4651 [Fictibacillus solisalsi]|uniref:Butirosin biosynthesis protein H, N-terminal n=1 Tax=Fictibacillus solisalsi TaxID=459525 RepID=A0A1H0BSM8_9BACL|nr:hypothetical protein [Fictibacillus solisalsi]SDN48664.1 hypothetical protein SAMN04488137_4651 [Fictibacillus solisalsi]
MSALKDRSFPINVPYYIPCDFPLISETLKSRGLYVSYTLLLNLDLVGLPVYFKDQELETMDMEIWYVNQLKYKGKFFSLSSQYFDDYSSANDYLQHQLKERKEPVICIGTTYYLPHSKDYIKKFGGHFLSVYEMDSSQAYVYDPVPHKYKGKVPIQDFEKFWKGAIKENKDFFKGTFGTIDVNIKQVPTVVTNLYFDTLKTVSYEFLKGQILKKKEGSYYYGKSCSQQLINDLKQSVGMPPATLEVVSKCLFDMRWSRYFLRDLLQEVDYIYGDTYEILVETLLKIIHQWELAYIRYNHLVLRNQVSLNKVLPIIKLIQNTYHLEQRFHEELYDRHSSYQLLEKDSHFDKENTL